jgi:hypothetical protein
MNPPHQYGIFGELAPEEREKIIQDNNIALSV